MSFLSLANKRRSMLHGWGWSISIPLLIVVVTGGILIALWNAFQPILYPSQTSTPEVLAFASQIHTPVVALMVTATILALLLAVTELLAFMHWRTVSLREQLDHEKTSFVRMAADTIRTPLTGLRWLTELLMGDDLGAMTGVQKESVGNMQRAIERLITLVNELLSIMRVSGGVVHYHPRPSDINIVIRGTVEDVKNIAAAKQQTVGFGELSRDSAMSLDEPLIRHLLTTLITNAMHLAPLREPIVVHAEPKAGEMVVGITYHGQPLPMKSVDQSGGLGMVPQDMAEVADDPLNMTISWEILTAAGGRFWVRDQGDEHTLFIGLPLGK